MDKLASKFIPTLNTGRDRYERFLRYVVSHAECYNAVLAQAYYYIEEEWLIEEGGFGNPHWRTLHRRGEAMRLLRQKIELKQKGACADHIIFTAAMLLSVEYAHNDHAAWLLHKRALVPMVADRGGLKQLDASLRDEMLRNEWFLQVLVKGRMLVCNWLGGATLQVQDTQLVEDATMTGLPPVFVALALRLALNTAAATFIPRFLTYLAETGPYRGVPSQYCTVGVSDVEVSRSELGRILKLVDARNSQFVEHQACLALLVYIFNLHHQAAPVAEYLTILDEAATEMITVKNTGPLPARKCLFWSVATIGAAATESPWRLHSPFMGHIIRMMARGDQHSADLQRTLHCYYLYGANLQEQPEKLGVRCAGWQTCRQDDL